MICMRLRNLFLASRFPLAAICTLGLVFVSQHVTSLDFSIQTAALSLITVALLPLLLYVGLFALAFAWGLITQGAVAVGDGFRIYDVVADFIPSYYQWLFCRRHPLLWGSYLGAILGLVASCGMILWIKEPGEKLTTEILENIREAILKQSEKSHSLPKRTEGQLLYRDIGIELNGFVLDSFGRPLDYDMRELSFRLRSIGYDGRPGTDDLCVTGRIKKLVPPGSAEQETLRDRLARRLLPKHDLKLGEHVTIRIDARDWSNEPPETNELMCPEK